MSRYIISPEASQDLDEISDYFLSRSIAEVELCARVSICLTRKR